MKPIFSILFWLFGALFLVSSAAAATTLIRSGRERRSFIGLSAAAAQAKQAEKVAGIMGIISAAPQKQAIPGNAGEGASKPGYTEYAALYAENSDFVGWLHMDNTDVDYPVMYTPDEPEYYLSRAFDKTHSQSGTPFIGRDGTIDSDFYIIYGHNMKNGAMFGTLDNYAEKAFWEENPSFAFTTITERREYEVFAALETRILYQDETGYRYYSRAGELTEEAFDELVGYFRENALYDTGIIPAYGEQIVVVSTCSYHEDNGRFIIAARRTDNAE